MGDKPEEKIKPSLKLEIIESMNTLATAGLGLVAALAWNDAVQTLFKVIFPLDEGSVAIKFLYAMVVTILIVLLTNKLSHMANKIKERAFRK